MMALFKKSSGAKIRSLRALALFTLFFGFFLFSGSPDTRAHNPELYKKLKKETQEGKVVQVKDGDTVVISPIAGGQFFTCRLYGIDAPETKHGKKPAQPYGDEAKSYLEHLILNKSVRIETTGSKTYNREICRVYLNNTDINREMVKRGYAWAYREYLEGPYASEYINAENEAREKGLGLWKQRNPLPPWEFRRRLRKQGLAQTLP